MTVMPEFPWYCVVRGTDLAQGDILLDCPRFTFSPDAARLSEGVTVDRESVDAIVLTQTCDLTVREDGNCEATDVLLCAIHFKNSLKDRPGFQRWETWEEIRKGRRPFLHLLNLCPIPGHEQDFAIVDFHSLFALSVATIRHVAEFKGDRLRLLPPYREHLSQSFARIFMRVGLPADIPPFSKPKSNERP